MKPAPFDYVAAQSVPHAVELLNGERDARVLAGGQSLLPLLNLRLAAPELVVDIGRLAELGSIDLQGESLQIGAGVTQHAAAAHPLVQQRWPMLAAAIGHIGHQQIRNQGTVCGSLAHNDPLAELPALALALEAELVVVGPNGERRVPAAEMFAGPFMTSVESGELVTAVQFPPVPPGTGWSVREFASRTGDFATAGVMTQLQFDQNVVTHARVVLFGVGSGPQRSEAIENAMTGATGPNLDDATLSRLEASIDPSADAHASAASRRELATSLVTASIAEAWENRQ